ncbi:MAG: hypothetical protein ACQETX_15190 [Pseudomonadota bacterium]
MQLARGMVEGGAALAVMGNHEFNAVYYATPHPERDGEFCAPTPPRTQSSIVPF